MTSRVVETEQARQMLIKFIENHELPMTATITAGKHRTTLQNSLQRRWLSEIAYQMVGTFESAEHVRGYCKLHIGVPIMREENEAFRLTYDKRIKPLAYEAKIDLMMVPISIPITSIMTTKQKTKYLDAVYRYFSAKGVILTNPEERGRAA